MCAWECVWVVAYTNHTPHKPSQCFPPPSPITPTLTRTVPIMPDLRSGVKKCQFIRREFGYSVHTYAHMWTKSGFAAEWCVVLWQIEKCFSIMSYVCTYV